MMKSFRLASISTHLLVFILMLASSTTRTCSAFAPKVSSTTSSSLRMGLFDGLAKAFANEEYGAPPDAVKATARHILVPTKEDAAMIQSKLACGESTFATLANEYSTCPSGKTGGSLGSFAPGTMVPEFDDAIFNPDTRVGELIGPIKTEFGYHLIVVDKRTGGGDWY